MKQSQRMKVAKLQMDQPQRTLKISTTTADLDQLSISDSFPVKTLAITVSALPLSRATSLITRKRFPKLVDLNLVGNGLQSIECLLSLDLTQVGFLNLRHNNLTEVRSLRKLDMPKLSELHLDGNSIIEGGTLPQINSKMQRLYIRLNGRMKLPLRMQGRSTRNTNPLEFFRPLVKCPQNYIYGTFRYGVGDKSTRLQFSKRGCSDYRSY